MHCSEGISLYRLPSESNIENCIASTPETRSICNDPGVAGCEYTRRLCHACRKVLELSPIALNEKETVVVNILRGGLNYGLRDALADAYGWNTHTTCFISAQRARNSADSEDWHITENDYAKVYFPEVASLVIGDVVATGTSLRYALQELLRSALEQRVRLRSILFFTFGGSKASDILEDIDRQCRELFPGYEKTVLVFFEGCFTCAEVSTPLSVRLTGTDLLRWHATMAPEFVESQYSDPAYPLERCTIYDAGSRAFWLKDYVEDVIGYWRQNLQFAEHGMTFRQLQTQADQPNLHVAAPAQPAENTFRRLLTPQRSPSRSIRYFQEVLIPVQAPRTRYNPRQQRSRSGLPLVHPSPGILHCGYAPPDRRSAPRCRSSGDRGCGSPPG